MERHPVQWVPGPDVSPLVKRPCRVRMKAQVERKESLNQWGRKLYYPNLYRWLFSQHLFPLIFKASDSKQSQRTPGYIDASLYFVVVVVVYDVTQALMLGQEC